MNLFETYSLHDLGKVDIPYNVLYAKYQDALETIMHYEERIYRLESDLEAFEEAYEEVSNKYYG